MLSKASSEIWEALSIGPQWLLRETEDPLLPASIAPTRSVRDDASRAPAQRATTASPSLAVPPPASLARAPSTDKPVLTPRQIDPIPVTPQGHQSMTQPMSAEFLEQIAQADWTGLRDLTQTCRACMMGGSRQHCVFSEGNAPQDFVIVGEAPGREEDLQGLPFVGNSGKLLTAMLLSLGIRRPEDVTILNVLKCRPPENRNPFPEEMQACSHFLERQLTLLKPKVVLVAGRFALQTLLETGPEVKIGAYRGRVHDVSWRGLSFKAVVTYHPSYLLRRPQAKLDAWNDLVLLKHVLQDAQIPVLGHWRTS